VVQVVRVGVGYEGWQPRLRRLMLQAGQRVPLIPPAGPDIQVALQMVFAGRYVPAVGGGTEEMELAIQKALRRI